jgi:hypothetical protein
MLFLYRPRQARVLPYVMRDPVQRQAYRSIWQDTYDATRRTPPAVPAPTTAPAPLGDSVARLKDLAALHSAGALTDAEFAAEKAKVLDGDASAS